MDIKINYQFPVRRPYSTLIVRGGRGRSFEGSLDSLQYTLEQEQKDKGH